MTALTSACTARCPSPSVCRRTKQLRQVPRTAAASCSRDESLDIIATALLQPGNERAFKLVKDFRTDLDRLALNDNRWMDIANRFFHSRQVLPKLEKIADNFNEVVEKSLPTRTDLSASTHNLHEHKKDKTRKLELDLQENRVFGKDKKQLLKDLGYYSRLSKMLKNYAKDL